MANSITEIDFSLIQNQLDEIVASSDEKIETKITSQLQEAKDSGEFTPTKGVDYFTEEDINQIVSEIVSNFIDVSEVGA